MVISLCSTNGEAHARPPTNYRWEFQTLNSVFLPDPFFIFLHHVFHISSLCWPDIEFVVPSSPIDLILTREISISWLCFVTIGMLHQGTHTNLLDFVLPEILIYHVDIYQLGAFFVSLFALLVTNSLISDNSVS